LANVFIEERAEQRRHETDGGDSSPGDERGEMGDIGRRIITMQAPTVRLEELPDGVVNEKDAVCSNRSRT
jgi:hypothetical protein